MKVDHLIVGQGLAGSLLAWHMLERGHSVLVVDRDEAVTSSKVAAGLVTPISGQQFSLPEGLECHLEIAKKTYGKLSVALGETFFHEVPMVRLFKNEAEIAQWQKRLGDPVRACRYQDFYGKAEINRDWFHDEYGGIELKQGGWLDVRKLVEKMRAYLCARQCYRVGRVDSADLTLLPPGEILWKEVSAGQVIFCEGWHGQGNHFFRAIPMNNARGDILRISCETVAAESRILNRQGWILPLGDGVYRAGASYDHHFSSEKPSSDGRNEIEGKIREILKPAFTVLGHESAVRPIIRRSQVYMGRHPEFSDIIYFNGLGSKGVMNAPSHTLALVEHLTTGKPLDERHDIQKHFIF